MPINEFVFGFLLPRISMFNLLRLIGKRVYILHAAGEVCQMMCELSVLNAMGGCRACRMVALTCIPYTLQHQPILSYYDFLWQSAWKANLVPSCSLYNPVTGTCWQVWKLCMLCSLRGCGLKVHPGLVHARNVQCAFLLNLFEPCKPVFAVLNP